MPRFVLHIGPHKTGTSYLQDAFHATRDELRGVGIHYPDTGRERAHYALLDPLRHNLPSAHIERQFAEMRAMDCDTIVLSAEGMATLNRDSIAYLRSLTGHCPVRVIYYCRKWGSLLPSHWRECAKYGDMTTLPKYLFTNLANPRASTLVNFDRPLSAYAECFGADAIRIVSYDSILSAGDDLFEHFCSTFLGVRAPRHDVKLVNASNTAADIEAIRALNGLETLKRGGAVPRRYARAMGRAYMKQKTMAAITHAAMQDCIETATIRIDDDLHRDLFAKHGCALVPPHLDGRLFDGSPVEVEYVSQDYLLAPGVVTELRELHNHLTDRLGRAFDSDGVPRRDRESD
jgi:hypothetical protein